MGEILGYVHRTRGTQCYGTEGDGQEHRTMEQEREGGSGLESHSLELAVLVRAVA